MIKVLWVTIHLVLGVQKDKLSTWEALKDKGIEICSIL